MKIEKDYGEVISSGNIETSTATIAATPELFKLLSSGVYEDKVLAIVREITCNGRDAMVEAGTLESKKMIMHLPNHLEPYWSLRDFGTGLTHDQIMKMYLSYGNSTKNESNDFIGAMGIGSKSPLNYTDNFMVISFKDGVERQYNIFMKEGIPHVSKMFERPTEEHNGLEIKLQVRSSDFSSFKTRAETFLKLFNVDVEVVGQQLDTSLVDVLEYDDFSVIPSNNFTNSYSLGGKAFARMGGVCYQINLRNYTDSDLLIRNNHQVVVIDFEIGDLSVAASRETLSIDSRTEENLKTRISDIVKSMKKQINEKIDEVKNLGEACVLASKHVSSCGGFKNMFPNWVTFKGKKLNRRVVLMREYLKSGKLGIFHYVCENSGRVERAYPSILMNSLTRNDKVHVLIADVKRGNKKAANHYKRRVVGYGTSVFYTSCEKQVERLQKLLNVDKIVRVSENYETWFPKTQKGSNSKNYVKSSGIFKLTSRGFNEEVTDLSELTGGYYLNGYRDCIESEQGTFKADTFKHVKAFVKEPIYLVRQTAFKKFDKAIKGNGAKFELLTPEKFELLLRKKLNSRARKRLGRIDERVNTYSYTVTKYLVGSSLLENLEGFSKVSEKFEKLRVNKVLWEEKVAYYKYLELKNNFPREFLNISAKFPLREVKFLERSRKAVEEYENSLIDKYPMLSYLVGDVRFVSDECTEKREKALKEYLKDLT